MDKARLDQILSLNVIDDAMFHKVAEDTSAVEEILRTVLEDESLTVVRVEPQKSLRNLGARSVVLDALCELSDGTQVAVEVQKRNDADHARRVRYVRSCLETFLAEQGCGFYDIPTVTVTFLSAFDPFGGGHAIYHVRRCLVETGQFVDDGAIDIYVNAAVADETKASRLMAFMCDSVGENSEFPRLAYRVEFLRETPEGRLQMSDLIEEYARQCAAEAAAEAAAKAAARAAEEATKETMLGALKALMANAKATAEDAMGMLDVPEEDRPVYRAALA